MSIYEILGYYYYSFTDQRTGQLIKGCSLYCGQDIEVKPDVNAGGKKTVKYTISEDLFNKLYDKYDNLVGLKIKFFFNENKRIVDFEVVEDEEF